MMKYKESFFNHEVVHEKERTLVYNSYSQAVCWFDKKTYSSFKGQKSIDPQTLLNDIIRLGFCVPCDEDEIQKVLSERETSYFVHDNLEYVIAPTLKCNMQCVYCFENASKKCITINDKNVDVLVAFIVKDIRTRKPKNVYIKWFGGEPTIAFEKIKLISAKLKEATEKENIKYFSKIVSNGYLLNGKMARQLKEQCSVISAQISLDGLKDTYSKMRNVSPDTFDVVVNNIIEASSFLNINIRLNVNSNNIEEMKELIYYLLVDKQLANKIRIHLAFVRDYNFNNFTNLSSEYDFEIEREKLLSQLIEEGFGNSLGVPKNQKRLFFCPVSKNASITIGPELDLYRCECLVGRSEHIIGTCNDATIDTTIDSALSSFEVPNMCKKCNLLPACGQGCVEQVYVEEQPIDCEAVKRNIYSNVRLMLKQNTFNNKERSESNGNCL